METVEKSNINIRRYVMVFTCMLIQAIPYGIINNIQPLFVPYVVNQFSFSLASFSLIFTFGAIAAAIFSPFLGKLYGKVNIKILAIAGSIIGTLSFLGFGFARNLPQFYILSAISQIGVVLFSGLGVPYVINNWFPKEGRGRALGIAFAGGSIGNIFLQQITSHMLVSKGFSYSYAVLGLFAMIVSLPLILLIIRVPKPDEISLLTTSEINQSKVKSEEKAHTFEGLGAKKTVSNFYFWIFTLGFAIIAIAISALSTQYATYFTNDLHFDANIIGTLGSLFAIFCLVGNVSGGVLFDKIGTFKTMFIAFVLILLAIIALLLAHNSHKIAFAFSILYGLNVYSYTCAPSFMAVDVFGKKDSSVILGTISLVFCIGFAFGSTLFGLIVDNFGFTAAWLSMLGCVIVGYILLLSSVLVLKKQNKQYI